MTTATVEVLVEGYIRRDGDRVSSTVGLVRDGNLVLVVDPGMVQAHASILDPLAARGLWPHDVTDVVFSHHHPDHTMNAALFPNARVHDHWAIYRNDEWESRDAEGFEFAPSVHLIRTPGHTAEDISTVVETADGVVVFTHAWWTATVPVEDPYATDAEALHASRARILGLNPSLIVPGHGVPFEPGADTPA